MDYRLVTIYTTSAGIEEVSNLLVIQGVGGFEVCDSADFGEFLISHNPPYDYVDEDLMRLCSQRSLLKFYTAINAQGDATISAVETALHQLKSVDSSDRFGSLEMTVAVVDDSAWKDRWKQFYQPMEIGDRLIVCPAWESVVSEKPVLKIDPGMAFGTGSHETTSLCLELLQKERLSGKDVLDVGCGSGILSQASVLLGAAYAAGCDIDEAAVSCAKSNAVLNGLGAFTDYYCGDLLECFDKRFGFVVANIVADVIKELTRDIHSVLTAGGVYIASGIIKERADEIALVMRECGFSVTEIKEKRGWVAIRAVLR